MKKQLKIWTPGAIILILRYVKEPVFCGHTSLTYCAPKFAIRSRQCHSPLSFYIDSHTQPPDVFAQS